ncbi:hypothetical protein B0H14DRAFT_2633717 [Mycena olivaceomarginata]|nr:hypothetical protein B0H14DRAFT_2633717 [Mycena olivaceomarginata]
MTVARSLAPQTDPDRTVQYNIRVSDKTILARLYTYVGGACIEYPESRGVHPIGHLIPIAGDLDSPLPWTDFVYSRGAPDSGTMNFITYLSLLTTAGLVCKIWYATCLGMKACPLANLGHLGSSYQHTIRDTGYNINYIAAVFTDDKEEAERIELEAKALNIRLLAKCKTVVNYSAQRSYCSVDHCLEGHLVQQEMAHLKCDVKFRIWWPVDCTNVSSNIPPRTAKSKKGLSKSKSNRKEKEKGNSKHPLGYTIKGTGPPLTKDASFLLSAPMASIFFPGELHLAKCIP